MRVRFLPEAQFYRVNSTAWHFELNPRNMCGIFAVIGQTPDAPTLVFKGLKDIEYRGYDSWGIACPNCDNFSIFKETGFLPKRIDLPKASLALGHTRWATHGGVTKENAHPHTDCKNKNVVVHNGIIENYLALKETLKKHHFKSATDTEVIAHLIEDELQKTNSFTKAVERVFKKLQGLNALVATDGKEIVAAKIGSPLVIGQGEDTYYLASDPNVLLPYTKKLLFIEDNQLVSINKSLKLFNLTNSTEIDPKFTTVKWEYNLSELAKFKTFLEKEIHEQPEVLRTLVGNSHDIENLVKQIKQAYGTFFIACGSASYSCLLGVYIFSKIAKKHVNFSVGSEFNYIEDYLTDKSLLIAVSQSGETIDVVEPISAAKKKGVKIASLVNVLGSTLYRLADYPLLLNAGMEKAVCSTKALTSMFAYMVLLAYSLIGKRKIAEKIILDSSKEIESILKRKLQIKKLAEKIYKSNHIFILGRGLSYPVALESALKIKENSYIHAEGFAGGELKHGVIALIEKGTPVIVFAPEDETKAAILANAMEVKARGAYIIGVAPKQDPVFDYFFEIKDTGASSVITNPVFAQLLSYYLALKLGFNPDKPRNLAKSVVVR